MKNKIADIHYEIIKEIDYCRDSYGINIEDGSFAIDVIDYFSDGIRSNYHIL